MKERDATEQAFRNGYQAGYKAGRRSMAAAEHVVHCRDCVHFNRGEITNDCDTADGMLWPEEDDYCSAGKKKEDAE